MNTNYGGYNEYVNFAPVMIPVTRSNISEVRFSLGLNGRSKYSIYDPSTNEYRGEVPYLSL